jgi:hypothetical protein
MYIVILVAFVDTEGDPSIALWVQASIYVCFSQSQVVLIITTKMAGYLLRAVIKAGSSTKW